MARTGRRPGDPDTRGRILEAARARFAAAGYRGATIRAIAADAGVDPALVHHYFGTKRELFTTVLDFPVDPSTLVPRVTDGPVGQLPERLLRTFLGVWDEPPARDRAVILLRSAVTDPDTARMMREFVLTTLLGPVLAAVETDHADLRAGLVASQLVGLAVARFVLRIEPIASASHDRLVAAYAPTLRRYLTGDVPGT